jgi:hypothetical protein
MPETIQTMDQFQNYLNRVMERAEHHGQNVSSVLLALAGAVILFKDASTNVEVRSYLGQTANVLWVTIRGRRYAFRYNHNPPSVEIRLGSAKGTVQHTFTNQTPLGEVLDVMREL